jgi:DNA-binding SARP family transcriptional activator
VWHQRYERNAASRDAIGALIELGHEMDARGALHRIECPVLMLHRVDDQVVPIALARETCALLRSHGVDVTFVEMPGADHFLYATDLPVALAAIERFTTGEVSDRARTWTRSRPAITTMGRFDIVVDGATVPTAEWGSRRARTLLKRLVVARGAPVPREELFDLLWPAEADGGRLGARLSVQLSAVRRVLRGGVVADRSSVRLDLGHVDVDLERWFAHRDDAAVVGTYGGELLPDDRYDEWTRALRDAVRGRFIDAARRLASRSTPDEAIGIWRRVLAEDRYDERAHRSLVAALRADARLGQARAAYHAYVAAMDDLSLPAASWDDIGT